MHHTRGTPLVVARSSGRHLPLFHLFVEFGSRIDLVQDFEFPEASTCVRLCPNGRSIVATGVYKPQVRVFDLDHMTIKFERHTTAETVSFVLLQEDWSKLVLLQSDRSIEFHTQGGVHYTTRIPRAGRDLVYDESSCDILVGGSSGQVYRLNLAQGRFLAPLESSLAAVNTLKMNPLHRLVALGGESGTIEYWDSRYRRAAGRLAVPVQHGGTQVSALEFLPDGLGMVAGTSGGVVLCYDLRSSVPSLQKDHQYGLPIKKISYHRERGQVVSADAKVVKVWDKLSGRTMASVEPPTPLNDLCLQQGTGFFMLANEGAQMQSFFVPSLGPAPRWCSFLDNLTEEMEENPQPAVYDNYKFVTKRDLDR